MLVYLSIAQEGNDDYENGSVSGLKLKKYYARGNM
jgi:hypothetical protein